MSFCGDRMFITIQPVCRWFCASYAYSGLFLFCIQLPSPSLIFFCFLRVVTRFVFFPNLVKTVETIFPMRSSTGFPAPVTQVNFVQPLIICHIVHALSIISRRCPLVECVYTFNVISTLACPSMSATALASPPWLMQRLANV